MGAFEDAALEYHTANSDAFEQQAAAMGVQQASNDDPSQLSPKARVLHAAANLRPEQLGVNVNLPNGGQGVMDTYLSNVVPGYGQDRKAGQIDLENKLQARNLLARTIEEHGGYEQAAQNDELVNNAVQMLGIQGNAQINRDNAAINRANNQVGGNAVNTVINNAANGVTGTARTVANAALQGVSNRAVGRNQAPLLDTEADVNRTTSLGENPYLAGASSAAGMLADPAARMAFKAAGGEGTPIVGNILKGELGQAAKGVVQSATKNALVMGGINATGHVAAGDLSGAKDAFVEGAEQGAWMGPLLHGVGEVAAGGVARALKGRPVPTGVEVPDTAGGGAESPEWQQANAAPAQPPVEQGEPVPTGAQQQMQDVDFAAQDQAALADARSKLPSAQSNEPFDFVDDGSPEYIESLDTEDIGGSDNGIPQRNQSDRPGVGEADAQQRGVGQVGSDAGNPAGKPVAQSGDADQGQVLNDAFAEHAQANQQDAQQFAADQHAQLDAIDQTADQRPDQIVPGSPMPNPNPGQATVPPQTKLGKVVQSVKNFLSNPGTGTADVMRDMRERFNFVGSKAGYDAPDVQRDLTRVVTAARHGDMQAANIVKGVYDGLPPATPQTVTDLGQHWRRQIMVESKADQMAEQIGGKGNPLNPKIAQAIVDAVGKADPVGNGRQYMKVGGNLTATPADVKTDIEAQLNAIDPALVAKFNTAAVGDSSPGALVAIGGNLPKFDANFESQLMTEPGVKDAIDRLNKVYSPLIESMRKQASLPMNPRATSKPLFLNLPTEPRDLSPDSIEPGVVVRKRFSTTATGEGSYIKDPEEYLRNVYSGHMKSVAEARLAKSLSKSHMAFDPTSPDVNVVDPTLANPNTTEKPYYEAEVNGKRTKMEAIDLSGPIDKPNLKLVPQDVAQQVKKIYQDNDPATKGPLGKLSNFATGMAILYTDAGSHSMRLWGNIARKVVASGHDWRGYIPGIGDRIATAHAAVSRMQGTPYGETMRQVNELIGADSNRGYQLGSQGDLHYSEKILFDRDTGVDPMLRAVGVDAGLRMKLGSDAIDKLEKAVNTGRISPEQATRWLSRSLKPADEIDLARLVNGTAGFLNTQTRSNNINIGRRFFPFLGSESGTIPHELQDLFTAGVDPASFKGTPMQVTGRVAQQLATGPIGRYLTMNAINYATTAAFQGKGRFMWQNDDGHKTDIAVTKGWYWTNMFPESARPLRIAGLKGLANGEGMNANTEVPNEILSMLPPAVKEAFTAGTGKALHVDPTGKLIDESRLTSIPTPVGRNAVAGIGAEMRRGGTAGDVARAGGKGLMKDVAGTFGIQLSEDNRSDRQKRMQQTGDVARNLSGDIQNTAPGTDERIDAFQKAKDAAETNDLDFKDIRTMGNTGARKDDYGSLKRLIDSDARSGRMQNGGRQQAKFNALFDKLRDAGAKPVDIQNALIKSGFKREEVQPYFEGVE